MHRLAEIQDSEELNSVLLSRFPTSTELLNVRHYVGNKLYSERVQTTFYALNGVIHDSALIVCLLRRTFPLETDLFVILSGPVSLETLPEDASKHLEATIDWSIPVIFAGVEKALAEELKLTEICNRNGILHHTTPCDKYYFPSEAKCRLVFDTAALNPQVKVKNLAVSEAKDVVSSWKFAGPGSLERMEDTISTIGSGGVTVAEGCTFKLVSWVVMNHDGTIGALHTLNSHRGKGFAKLAMNWVTKHCMDRGCTPTVHIEEYNEESKALMKKLGYKFAHKVVWGDMRMLIQYIHRVAI